MKILFITLSNLGDVVLSLPVLDALKERFPEGRVTVMVGPRAREVFSNSSHYIDRLIIYDKYSKLGDKIRLFNELKKERFDAVVDLRNSLLGALLPARYRTSPFLRIPKTIQHLKERNLYRLQDVFKSREPLTAKRLRLSIDSPQDKDYIEGLLLKNGIKSGDKVIAISIAAASTVKLWSAQRFIQLCNKLSGNYKLILIGSQNHKALGRHIYDNCPGKVLDFTGLTTMGQLVSLLKRADAVITCDTGVLHLASYLDRPVVAIFGPADEFKYGPWSGKFRVVTKEIFCRPCEKAQCRFKDAQCISLIKADDVLRAVEALLTGPGDLNAGDTALDNNFKRILVVRTDRVGDVVLTTPVLKALRDNCPHSYIAVMVSPHTRELVEGNPYIDEVIVYSKPGRWLGKPRSSLKSIDTYEGRGKDKTNKGPGGFWKFVMELKKKKFDLAIILHTKKRTNLITYLADIPQRIGYQDKNFGFLLSDRIEDTRHLGLKHEVDYCLDILRKLGMEVKTRLPYIAIKRESLEWVDGFLQEQGLSKGDKIAGIHPGASCVSKRWLKERFVVLANRLVEDYGLKLIIVASGEQDIAIANELARNVRYPSINLAGKTSLSQLAAVLKRCAIFISNDSGPVHIASSVGTPVISIFGRNQAGLSPVRWGPLGKQDKYLHKEVGCSVCLAHKCKLGLDCLKAITVEDVLKAVDGILKP